MLDFHCNVFVRANPISTCQPDHSLRITTGADNSPSWTNYTPVVSERTSGTSKLNHSGIKNVDAQSASSQTVSATREYDAFGNVTSSTGCQTGRFGYGGSFGYQEDEGGLKQLGHRIYDFIAGRFVTKGRMQGSRNWFIYCFRHLHTYADKEGLQALGVIAIVALDPKPISKAMCWDDTLISIGIAGPLAKDYLDAAHRKQKGTGSKTKTQGMHTKPPDPAAKE